MKSKRPTQEGEHVLEMNGLIEWACLPSLTVVMFIEARIYELYKFLLDLVEHKTHFYSLAYSTPVLPHSHCDTVCLLVYFLCQFLCQSHAYSLPKSDPFIDHSFTRYVSQ